LKAYPLATRGEGVVKWRRLRKAHGDRHGRRGIEPVVRHGSSLRGQRTHVLGKPMRGWWRAQVRRRADWLRAGSLFAPLSHCLQSVPSKELPLRREKTMPP
jgi:hypothetical protein